MRYTRFRKKYNSIPFIYTLSSTISSEQKKRRKRKKEKFKFKIKVNFQSKCPAGNRRFCSPMLDEINLATTINIIISHIGDDLYWPRKQTIASEWETFEKKNMKINPIFSIQENYLKMKKRAIWPSVFFRLALSCWRVRDLQKMVISSLNFIIWIFPPFLKKMFILRQDMVARVLLRTRTYFFYSTSVCFSWYFCPFPLQSYFPSLPSSIYLLPTYIGTYIMGI